MFSKKYFFSCSLLHTPSKAELNPIKQLVLDPSLFSCLMFMNVNDSSVYSMRSNTAGSVVAVSSCVKREERGGFKI